MARFILFHSSCKGKNDVNSSLWPMAVNYSCYIFNDMPNKLGIAPIDVFTGMQAPRHKLFDIHTWGCPVYVLDPKIQVG